MAFQWQISRKIFVACHVSVPQIDMTVLSADLQFTLALRCFGSQTACRLSNYVLGAVGSALSLVNLQARVETCPMFRLSARCLRSGH